MIRLFLVDDDPLVLESLSIILGHDPYFQVLGVANNGEEALASLEKLTVDIVLLDIQMPGMGGITACEKIKETWPQIKVVMLTTFHDYQNIHLSLKAGASGYLLKSDDTPKQKETLKAVFGGLSIISTQALKGFQEETKEALLTHREQELMILVANGFSNKEMAEKLSISEGTVRNSLSVILEKLMLRDRTQLAIYYWQRKTGQEP